MLQSRKYVLLAAGLLLLGGFAIHWLQSQPLAADKVAAVPTPVPTPVSGNDPESSTANLQAAASLPGQESAAPVPQQPVLPVEVGRRYPPGTRVPLTLPWVDAGIQVGPGQFLPPLNGVRVEDGIPPIRRNRQLPPLTPVVAKVVDLQGQEWWEHEDGSQTSCSFASVTTADGTEHRIVSTQHGAVQDSAKRQHR